MSASLSGVRHAAIQEKLLRLAGDDPDAGAIADASVRIWGDVAAMLAPVLGARGVDALCSRSLHMTGKRIPWLVMSGVPEDLAGLVASLKSQLLQREPEAAIEASCAVLTTFSELLVSLLGDRLTDRLLAPLWASALPGSAQEKQS